MVVVEIVCCGWLVIIAFGFVESLLVHSLGSPLGVAVAVVRCAAGVITHEEEVQTLDRQGVVVLELELEPTLEVEGMEVQRRLPSPPRPLPPLALSLLLLPQLLVRLR